MNKIFIGTSGYSYQDWKENFYPPEIENRDFLDYYSNYFNTVELNFTYYCFPSPHNLVSLCKKVGKNERFVFSLKANSKFTHERVFSSQDSKNFLECIDPIKDSGRLGSILFQFPYSFKYNKGNLGLFSKIREDFYGYEICFEFRHISWLNHTALEKLQVMDIGFCNVDEPGLNGLLPATGLNTSENGYIRFHGRNSQYWWKHEAAYQRYDYMYCQEELAEWLPKTKKIIENTKKTYIYFNNHYKGKATKSAMLFLELLKDHNIYTSQN